MDIETQGNLVDFVLLYLYTLVVGYLAQILDP